MWQLSHQRAFKKTSKLVNFCVAILILKMEKMQHFQHIMLYYFKKGKNTTKTLKKFCVVYGEGAVTNWTCQKCFVKFCAGDFSLDDSEQLGRPAETLDSNQTEALIQNNQCYTTWEIANILEISKSIKFLVKMKNVCFILQKKHMDFLANLILSYKYFWQYWFNKWLNK